MTDLERALAEGGQDVTDLQRALNEGGEDVTPKGRTSKYPQSRRMNAQGEPESFAEEDARVGVANGPEMAHRMPGVGLTIHSRDPGPVEREQLINDYIGTTQRVENAAGTATAGGILGNVARGAAAAPAAARIPGFGPAVATAAPKAGNALQTAILGALMGQGFGGSNSGGTGALAGGVAGLLLPPAFRGIIGAAPAVARASLPMAGAVGAAAGPLEFESDDEALQKVARMLMGGKPLGKPPQFPQGE